MRQPYTWSREMRENEIQKTIKTFSTVILSVCSSQMAMKLFWYRLNIFLLSICHHCSCVITALLSLSLLLVVVVSQNKWIFHPKWKHFEFIYARIRSIFQHFLFVCGETERFFLSVCPVGKVPIKAAKLKGGQMEQRQEQHQQHQHNNNNKNHIIINLISSDGYCIVRLYNLTWLPL